MKPDIVGLNVTMPLVNGSSSRRRARSRGRSQKPQLSFRHRMRTNILLRKPGRLVCAPMSRNRRLAKPSSGL